MEEAPLLIVNDMTAVSAAAFDFGGPAEARIFFSSDGLAGASGVDGAFDNGFLSLAENTRLFRTREYKHVWTAQIACSAVGAAATVTHVRVD